MRGDRAGCTQGKDAGQAIFLGVSARCLCSSSAKNLHWEFCRREWRCYGASNTHDYSSLCGGDGVYETSRARRSLDKYLSRELFLMPVAFILRVKRQAVSL